MVSVFATLSDLSQPFSNCGFDTIYALERNMANLVKGVLWPGVPDQKSV